MLNKNQIKDFMSAMKENGDVSPMDVSLENMSIFADTQGVELDEVMEFCQIAEEMNFSSLDFNVPTEPGVSEQEIGLIAEDYRDWLKKNNLKNNLKSLQDYLKEKSQNEEVTKELLVKIPRYWSENNLSEFSDEEDYENDPHFRRYCSMLRGFKNRGDMEKYKELEDYIKRFYPKANISSILSKKKETTHSSEEEDFAGLKAYRAKLAGKPLKQEIKVYDKEGNLITTFDHSKSGITTQFYKKYVSPAKEKGYRFEEDGEPVSSDKLERMYGMGHMFSDEETNHSDEEEEFADNMSDDEKKSAKEQLTNLKDKIAKSDFADANSVKEFIECCGQVVELGKKFGKPEEFAKTVFDKPTEEPKTLEGKSANFSGEDKPQKGKFDYFDLYIKK